MGDQKFEYPIAHWLSVSGDYGSNPGGREKNYFFFFEL